MRIAVLHNLPTGGARRRLAAQLEHLDAELLEFTLGSAEPVTERPHLVPYGARAERARRALRPPLRYGDLARLLSAWRRLATEINAAPVDVVYANPCRYLRAPAALPRLRRPSLFFCDEPRRASLEPEVAATINPATRPLYAPLYAVQARVDRRGARGATRLATNSEYTRGQIRLAYGRDATVVPMGVGEGLEPGDADGGGHLLSVGTLGSDKGHDLVLRAAAEASARPPVVIVTPRPDPDAATALYGLATRLGVELDLRTGVSDAELARAYTGSLATVYMARREPFGLASIEAQACGSPVVVAAEGGLPETIVEGTTGWAVARDPRPVAARIDLLAAEPARRERMAAAARAHGAGHSWRRSAEAIQDLLEELVA